MSSNIGGGHLVLIGWHRGFSDLSGLLLWVASVVFRTASNSSVRGLVAFSTGSAVSNLSRPFRIFVSDRGFD